MSKYPGQATSITSPKGVAFEYWFGVAKGKRSYLVLQVGTWDTWYFESAKEVKQFIREN